ncbi:hypothetical protein [Streptomyces cyaneofuscatus]|uniref:hypothetical protein n=1 Tax=Streptomyces cyaneofuscatus TaxID=66883 RepID=UPI0033B9991C
MLSFTNYDQFVATSPRAAQIVLQNSADPARRAAVAQRRFFVLVHSNDPEIRFDPVGAMPVMWNSDDWLDCKRR